MTVITFDNVIRKQSLSQLFPKGKTRVEERDRKADRRRPREGMRGVKDLARNAYTHASGISIGRIYRSVRIDGEADDREGEIDRYTDR